MRFKSYLSDKRDWHVWFAWYPVRLEDDEQWAWLEKVERRLIYWSYTYREDRTQWS